MFFLEQIWGSVDFYGVFLTTIKNLDKFFYIIYKCTTPSRISWEKSFYIYKFSDRIFLKFFLKKLKITFRNYSKNCLHQKVPLGFFGKSTYVKHLFTVSGLFSSPTSFCLVKGKSLPKGSLKPFEKHLPNWPTYILSFLALGGGSPFFYIYFFFFYFIIKLSYRGLIFIFLSYQSQTDYCLIYIYIHDYPLHLLLVALAHSASLG